MILAANIAMALVWMALIGPFSPANFVVGFVAGYAALAIATAGQRLRAKFGEGRESPAAVYVRRLRGAALLTLFTVYELVVANVKVARWTVSPLADLRPAVVGVPLAEGMSDIEVTLLSSLITLTPGTLTLDISDDRSLMYVHVMHTDDPEEEVRAMKRGFERRVLEVTR